MHPTISYELAKARTADLRHQAQHAAHVRTARRARPWMAEVRPSRAMQLREDAVASGETHSIPAVRPEPAAAQQAREDHPASGPSRTASDAGTDADPGTTRTTDPVRKQKHINSVQPTQAGHC